MRLCRRSGEAGRFTGAVQLPLRFKPVDLGVPDWATSRQPEIECELFDCPDITSFLRTWVFVTQIRVIVHLVPPVWSSFPGPEKLRSLNFRKSADNGCKGNAAN